MAEERSYPQITNETIQVWGETVGVSDLPSETLQSLSADATYRLQQVLSNCSKLLSHSNRKKLTSDDFNRVLKWMDFPGIYGYSGSESTDWVSLPELGIFAPHDPPVNLASTALSGDIFHQPGSCYVKAKWAHVNGHIIMKSENNSDEKNLSTIPLTPDLTQYYRTLFSAVTSPSNTLFQTMCEDVGSSANIGPLVGPIIRSVLKGAQKARQKPLILRRLLLIIRALLFNPNIHLGPHNYIHDIVNVLVFSVVTERKSPLDTQSIRTLAANILLKLSRNEGEVGTAWELAVISLSGVVGSSTRPWTQHAGALTGLSHLGFHALDRALSPIASTYYPRLSQILANPPSVSVSSAISAKDTLDAHMTAGLLLAGFVNMMVEFMKRLPDHHKIRLRVTKTSRPNMSSSQQGESDQEDESGLNISHLIHKLRHLYFLGAEMFGSAFVLQIPSVYLNFEKDEMSSLHFKNSKISAKESMYHNTSSPFSDNGVPSSIFRSSNINLESRWTNSPCRKKPRRSQLRQLKKPSAEWFLPNGNSIVRKQPSVSPNQIFDNYKRIIPVKKRKIYMCVRGCSTRNFEFLKQRKGTLPEIRPHPNRELLTKQTKKNIIGRMPHWTFISPSFPLARPCYTLMFQIL